MGDKKIRASIHFGSGLTTIEEIVTKLPFLKKLDEMSPENTKCDNRTIQVNRDGTYSIEENKSGFGGEGGVEAVNFPLGEYKYRKKGSEIEKINSR